MTNFRIKTKNMINEFLNNVYHLKNDKCIDFIYDQIDLLFRNNNFHIVDKIISEVNISILSDDIILSFLTITLAAKSKLPSREIFFDKVKQRLETNLLKGLE